MGTGRYGLRRSENSLTLFAEDFASNGPNFEEVFKAYILEKYSESVTLSAIKMQVMNITH